MSNNMLDLISKQVRDLDTAKRDDEVEKILLWISPASFQSKQADMLEGVQPGTGSWFLEDAVFRSWMEGQVDVLWCPGIRKSPYSGILSYNTDNLYVSWRREDQTGVSTYCKQLVDHADTGLSVGPWSLTYWTATACITGAHSRSFTVTTTSKRTKPPYG